MFWLPSKTIYTGPKRQRGNIVIDAGLPPAEFILPNGNFPDGSPSGSPGWTLLNRWDIDQGDLPSIVAAFGPSGAPHGIAWSPDGSKVTLASAGADMIKTFVCSPAWNLPSAVEISSHTIVNPQQLTWQEGGNLLFTRKLVGDEYVSIPGNNYVVSSSPVLTQITKTDLQAGGSTDGFVSFRKDAAYFQSEQDGPVGGNTLRQVSFVPPGKLDGFVLGTATTTNGFSVGATQKSVLSLNEENYYQCLGSQGVAIVLLPNHPDPTGNSQSAPSNQGMLGFRFNSIWVDPNDTRFAWGVWNTFGGRFARFDTGLT